MLGSNYDLFLKTVLFLKLMSRHQELIDEALGRTTAVKINENKLKFQELMTVYQKFCNIYAF